MRCGRQTTAAIGLRVWGQPLFLRDFFGICKLLCFPVLRHWAQAHCGYLCQWSYSTMGEAPSDQRCVPATFETVDKLLQCFVAQHISIFELCVNDLQPFFENHMSTQTFFEFCDSLTAATVLNFNFLTNVWVQRPFTSKFNNRYEPREQTFCLTSVYWCYFTMDSDNSERMRSNCLRWISYQLVHVRALMMWSGWFVLLILQFAICCTTVPIVE